MLETASVLRTKGRHAIHCLTVVGQIEGHSIAPQNQKTTKYEHVIPQLVSIEEDPEIEGLLVILNTVGGDVEAGLALAELISGVTKPSATLVLGGGHSIGIPLAVSAQRSFIVPTATMTIHPVRHSGLVLGVPQTMRYFEQMQQRITSFVTGHSQISAARFTELMMHTGELVMDVGSVLDGKNAVKEGLIDSIGSIGDALAYLYDAIEGKTEQPARMAKSPKESRQGKPKKSAEKTTARKGAVPAKRGPVKAAKTLR
ncbi:MAG: ATP-dependent Clp protease proteolytic subunit [Ruthenibacterium sp.]